MKQLQHPIFSNLKRHREKYLRMGLLLFFVWFPIFALSENRHTLPPQAPQTTTAIELLQKRRADSLFDLIAPRMKDGDFANAENAASQSLILYQLLNDDAGIGNSQLKMATIAYYTSDFQKALHYYDESMETYQKIDFQKGIATCLNNKGAIYYHLGKYPKALAHYKKALALNEAAGHQRQIATALRNIGGIYLELEETDKAMAYLTTARDKYKALNNEKALAQVMTSIGDIYMAKAAYAKALEQLDKSLALSRKIGDQQHVLVGTYSLAQLQSKMEAYPEALRLYDDVLQRAKALNNKRYTALGTIARGHTQRILNNWQSSLTDCTRGLALATRLQLVAAQRDACNCLYLIHKTLRHHNKALFFYEQSKALTDSLHTKKTANKILQMEFEKEQLLDSIAQVESAHRLAVAHEKTLAKKEQQRNAGILSASFVLILAGVLWSRLRFTKKSRAKLQLEKDRSEHLLLNILPEEIAEELKTKGYVDAQDVDRATILFTDFKAFTETASRLSPQELVEEINVCFKAFDAIMEVYHIEKIKTIGDAYMAAGGLPKPDARAVKNTILAALDMQAFIKKRQQENAQNNKPAFEMRVGVHVGPIVAGIVGVKKFQYDIWGDTVNTASRMESNGEVGKVNISADTYALIKNESDLSFTYRGAIEAKGKGALAMYFVSKKMTA